MLILGLGRNAYFLALALGLFGLGLGLDTAGLVNIPALHRLLFARAIVTLCSFLTYGGL